MRKRTIVSSLLAFLIFNFQFSTLKAQDTVRKLDEVMIQDVRVSNTTPLTTSTVGREELQEARSAVSIPFMLETQPSVVASSENGLAGATSIRIRGVDASRINVNLNGITLNDPESQAIYWADIPNLGGMAQSLQIQRGVGASTGGSPAFGAAINVQTLNARSEAYGMADLGFGSWNTRQYSLSAGSGILRSGLSFDVAYSGLTSDGFVRGGLSDQQSFFACASWYGERTLVKLIAIIGRQKSGITWDGADSVTLDADPHYNGAGKMDIDGNTFYYRNATDNYLQQHYQLYVSHMLGDRWSINGAFNYARGDGYDEHYKQNKSFSQYNMPFAGQSDFIVRSMMASNGFTANLAARRTGERSTLSVGVNTVIFDGYHYGNVMWCRDTSVHFDAPFSEWYDYNGHKVDVTSYVKGTYDFNDRLNAYADLQLRVVDYTLNGFTDDWNVATADWVRFNDFTNRYTFFNPKAGLNYRTGDRSRAYFVAGIMGREPTRSDIKGCYAAGDSIRAEEMLDFELGYQIVGSRWTFNANVYAMLYKDQLTPNGIINNAGYGLMENVDRSYRIGVELEGGYRFTDWFRMDANLTLSRNKVLDYTYSDFADGDTVLHTVTATTDLALSPSVVGAAIATFTPIKNAKLQLIGKYVGKQYSDNSGRECYAIAPYFLLNLRASYTFHLRGSNEIECQLLVNNLLGCKYRLSAWVGDEADNQTVPGTIHYYHTRAYLQQPGINFMGRVTYRF